MRFTIEFIKLIMNKIILRKSIGTCMKIFCTNMGITYIKLGQILAMQNINGIFSEEDRQQLLSICDSCNKIDFEKIESIIKNEYNNIPFKKIYTEPIGSASVSQVHKAILKTGETVAIKIKRQDIAKTINKDIAQIKFCVKHFGRFVNITNIVGSYHALNFYLQWITQETDFINELDNIEMYTNFVNSVNGKLNDCKNIVVPKVYKEYCTENIIVMEYIPYKTISNLKVTQENSIKINKAMESYIKLSFYALFNGLDVVWHGDPHAGNIYIDDCGNAGFLDMGLVFKLNKEEIQLTLDFFFCAYFGDWNKLYNMLEPYIKDGADKKNKFRETCKNYCNNIKNKPITSYFMDLVWVCLEYHISPPDFLYGMAKAFVCLFGIDTVYDNTTSGKEVIEQQVIEYVLRKSIADSKCIINNSKDLIIQLLNRDTIESSKDLYKIRKSSRFIIGIIKNILRRSGGTIWDEQ